MAKKKFMKDSEARIIVYLMNVEMRLRFVAAISRKLNIDYVYVIRVLTAMKDKGWLITKHHENKTFYQVSSTCPKATANKVLAQPSQRKL